MALPAFIEALIAKGLLRREGAEAVAATGGGTWLARLIAALADAGINTGLNYATGD